MKIGEYEVEGFYHSFKCKQCFSECEVKEFVPVGSGKAVPPSVCIYGGEIKAKWVRL